MLAHAAILSAAWIDGGQPLPSRCALHGEPAASTRKLRILTPAPNWIFLLLLAGVVPFLIANHVLRKRVDAAAWPFCARCRRERLVRLGRGLGVLAVGTVLFALAQTMESSAERASQTTTDFGVAQLIGIAGVMAMLFGVFMTRRGLWRHVAGAVLTLDRQRVVVQPAHPAFIDEVPPQARAEIPVPPGVAPTR